MRDILNSLKELKTNEIHFRHHPDGKYEWIHSFINLLKNHNINAKLVASDLPIRELVCNYKAFIGLTSESLKDARASCENCIVVGFEAASQYRFKNSKFIFGKSDGIGWIDINGQYKKEIFSKIQYSSLANNSIPDIMKNYL